VLFVVGVALQRVPRVEINNKTMHVATLDLFRAFGFTACEIPGARQFVGQCRQAREYFGDLVLGRVRLEFGQNDVTDHTGIPRICLIISAGFSPIMMERAVVLDAFPVNMTDASYATCTPSIPLNRGARP
jgi:hypothetical protein